MLYFNANLYFKDGKWFCKITQKGKIAAWESASTRDGAYKAAVKKADEQFGGSFPPEA